MLKTHCDFCDDVIVQVVGDIFGQLLPNSLGSPGDQLLVTVIDMPGPPGKLEFRHVCGNCISRALDNRRFTFQTSPRCADK